MYNAAEWCMGKDPFKVQEKPMNPNVKRILKFTNRDSALELTLETIACQELL